MLSVNCTITADIFKVIPLRRAVRLALLSASMLIATPAIARTDIITDTDVSTAPAGEIYYVSQGASLTGSGASTGQIILGPSTDPTAGNLRLSSGSIIDGQLLVQNGSRAELSDTTVTGLISVGAGGAGFLSLNRVSVGGELNVVSGSTALINDSNLLSVYVSSGGDINLNNSMVVNSRTGNIFSTAGAMLEDGGNIQLNGSSVTGGTGLLFMNAVGNTTPNVLTLNGSTIGSTSGAAI